MSSEIWAEPSSLFFSYAKATSYFLLDPLNPEKLSTLFSTISNPLLLSFTALLAVVFGCYSLQLLTKNYSWVDRVWSLTPFSYVWIITLSSLNGESLISYLLSNPRILALITLSTTWGIRLTYNFARKDGYNTKTEDYRWEWIHKNLSIFKNEYVWETFAFAFISLYQNVLLWLITAPTTWIAVRAVNDASKWNVVDTISLISFSALLLGETVCDEQQYEYQQKKWGLIEKEISRRTQSDAKLPNASTGNVGVSKKLLNEVLASLPEQYSYGFATHGVFQYSRHLNFYCEQAMWWAFYGFGVATTLVPWELESVLNLETTELAIRGFGSVTLVSWALIGPVLLSLLFQGSTELTEYISIQKYPLYRIYQQTTARLFPSLPGLPLKTAIEIIRSSKTPSSKAD
ncbi:hypothetical protein HK098_007770 [Nowakowskiella sp. JEL0407]|nr:hypothetical protein HK098_007770 [Nowakowskiella sp. JEL0407]